MTANALAPSVERDDAEAALARVVLEGDLSKLSPTEKVTHYQAVCQSLGLNPLTQPFGYMRFQGKEILYARKECADQLRALRNVSLEITSRTIAEGICIVAARATLPNGRRDEDLGAVALDNLRGEARANAILKCITKAKRRATLSVCGLGFLDETEVGSIEGAEILRDVPNLAQRHEPAPEPPAGEPEEELPLLNPNGELVGLRRSKDGKRAAIQVWEAAALRCVGLLEDRSALAAWTRANEPHLVSVASLHPDAVANVRAAIEAKLFEPIEGDAE